MSETALMDGMPGADSMESPEGVDLNFGLGEEVEAVTPETESEPEVEVQSEEEVEAEPATAEVEEAESDEEAPAETESALAEAPEEVEAVQPEPKERPKQRSKQPMVPKSRLDEVLAKQKALQKQLDALKASQPEVETAPEEYDFDAKELEYQQFVLDGESQKAMALRKDIRAAEKAQIQFDMTQKMAATNSNSHVATALQQAAAAVEAEFPVFDRTSDTFNEEYTNEVVELRDAFMTKGDNAVEALSKAVRFVVKSYDLDSALETAPNPDLEIKKKAAISKKIQAANAQPPVLEGEGTRTRDTVPIDVMRMSEDEFNALPEATLKRLRGDIV